MNLLVMQSIRSVEVLSNCSLTSNCVFKMKPKRAVAFESVDICDAKSEGIVYKERTE